MKTPTRYLITLIAAALLFAGILVVVSTSSASGADFTLTSDIDTNKGERGDPGSVKVLASASTPTELVGESCVAKVTSTNNESTHPDNDLIIGTGAETVEFEDVEATASAVNETEGDVVLGSTVTMSPSLKWRMCT